MRSYNYRIFFIAFFTLFLLPAKVITVRAQIATPENHLELGFYSDNAPFHFIIVEKLHQKLKLFEQKDSLRMIKEFTCATGANPGIKKTSGDSRTPEGLYHITEIYEDKRITVFGSRAFHLDYPNAFDANAGRLGDGIFIHGTNKKLIPNSTNGCITLKNSDLDELAPYLAVNTTPVIILDTDLEFIPQGNLNIEKNGSRFLDAIEKISLNSPKTPIEKIQTLTYLKFRDQIIVSVSYVLSDEKMTQYNEHKRSFLRQSPSGNWRTLYAVQYQDTTPRILALHPTKHERSEKPKEPSIIVDKTVQKPNADVIKPVVSPAKATTLITKTTNSGTKTIRQINTKPLPDKSDEILNFVEKWRTAWASKDIETYINCYSPSFKNGDLNRDAWRLKKDYLNKKYNYISVTLRNIAVEWTSAGATVTFQQTYKSDQLQYSGVKKLQLVNKKNHWLIENELI
jgi:murein L,D-transpeptidase YafK